MANKRAAELSRTDSLPSSPATPRSASGSSKASSPTEQSKQIDFQFLNFSHPADAKASRARKTVRSHVTRQQHQKEHAAAAARRAKSLPQPDDEDQDSEPTAIGRSHAATFPPNRPILTLPTPSSSSSRVTNSPEASSQSPSPINSPSYPSDLRLDPLEVYPDEWHPYLSGIIDHYLSTFAVDIPYLDGPDARGLLRTRFYPLCLSDCAPLHAVMLLSASHLGNARGERPHAIDALQLRGMAISEINSALEDPVRATSDQVIAAVANMASYEALFGDRQIFNTHMTGLLRMVSLRGGLPALGLSGLLERILLWIDSNAAHIMGSKLYFDKAAFPSNVQHPQPDPQRFTGGLARRPPP